MIVTLISISFFTIPVNAESMSSNKESIIDEYYQEQLEASGAKDLWNKLPKETKESLTDLGLDDFDWHKLTELNLESVFSELAQIAVVKSSKPIQVLVQIIGIIILCALMEGMKLSFSDGPLSGIIGVVSVLCICLVIINPVVSCISNTAQIIKTAAIFMLSYIPIIVGLMLASGQTFSAASYNMMMVGVSEIIAQLSSGLLIPLLNVFLSISIISSISTKLNFKGICNTALTVFKWVLGCIMTVFISVLGLQTIVGSSADSAGLKTAKFVINSFVPVVGSALGEAFGAIQGSVKLLRSGVGAFGLIAISFIFIPPLIEGILWLISLNISAGVGDIFNLNVISSLLRSTSKVMGLIIAIMLCCMTVLIISTVIVLKTGGV